MKKKPKIIFWDVETSQILGVFWGLNNVTLSYENIVRDWFIISGSWRVLGENRIHSVAVDPKNPSDDYNVVKTLRDVLESADIIVHHNGDKFDLKKLNARLIYHNLKPLPNIPTVDTLKEARKIAKFTSNRLDYLAKFLGFTGKIPIEYKNWFDIVTSRDKEVVGAAIKRMTTYNRFDTVLLEYVYLRLRPFMRSHPHVGSLSDEDRHGSCPKCGSINFKKNGIRIGASGIKKQECQCKKCYSYFKIPIKNA